MMSLAFEPQRWPVAYRAELRETLLRLKPSQAICVQNAHTAALTSSKSVSTASIRDRALRCATKTIGNEHNRLGADALTAAVCWWGKVHGLRLLARGTE